MLSSRSSQPSRCSTDAIAWHSPRQFVLSGTRNDEAATLAGGEAAQHTSCPATQPLVALAGPKHPTAPGSETAAYTDKSSSHRTEHTDKDEVENDDRTDRHWHWLSLIRHSVACSRAISNAASMVAAASFPLALVLLLLLLIDWRQVEGRDVLMAVAGRSSVGSWLGSSGHPIAYVSSAVMPARSGGSGWGSHSRGEKPPQQLQQVVIRAWTG